MATNVTELPRSGRHVQSTPIEDPVGVEARAARYTQKLIAVGTGISFAWILLCGWYVAKFLRMGFSVSNVAA